MDRVFDRLVKYLDDSKIPFESIEHPSAASAGDYQRIVGTRLEQQAKALFIRYKKPGVKGFAIIAVAAQKQADLELIRKLLHANEIRLGSAEQLKEATGCNYGELPPFGKLFSLPLFFDRELLTEEKIFFNAGKLTASITLNPHHLVKIEEPIMF